MAHYDFSGKTVLVTGASLGLGAELAKQLAARGATLVLVARSRERLEAVARGLPSAHVVAVDLTERDAARRVHEAVVALGLEIDVLVNNAGYGLHAAFEEIPLAEQRGQIALNVDALVELTHVFMPMIERRRGGVLQVASMAGLMPTPFMAVYGATKAFVISFASALRAEYASRGVRVVTLIPGATETSFFERAGTRAAAGMRKARPEDVVSLAIRAFERDRSTAVAGFANRIFALLLGLIPRDLAARMVLRIARPAP